MTEVPEYTLTRKRMKYIRMRVTAPEGEVLVSAPHHVTLSAVDDFVGSRSGWIAKKRAALMGRPAPLKPGPEADALRVALRDELDWLVPYWVQRMEVPMPDVRIRLMRSRWGSCNQTARRITLNLELARHDFDLLEYVVIHELAHLIHANHGPGFYAVMDAHCPEWKTLRRRLNGKE